MPLNLTILGSGSAVPILTRGVTSQYLNISERRILIDCGEGTQLQLRKFQVKFQRLQFIFISHLHGDHFYGIFGLVSSMSLLGRTNKLIIYGPDGLEEIVRHQFKLSQVYLKFEIEFKIIASKDKELIFEDNSIEIWTFPLKHRIKCQGFLFKEKPRGLRIDSLKIKKYNLSLVEILAAKQGKDVERETGLLNNKDLTLPPEKLKSYAFCSDTSYLEKLPDWIRGASLLYHEATFTNKHKERAKKTGHSTAEDAANIAKKAGVEKLILGHFSTRYADTTDLLAEAKAIFNAVKCVEDGDVFLV